ncbi:hypothetical protein [Agarilytica rhodophyticola]|uniref:hypothetical protein n=1 Tax=Agarilytica rhodophyticola TaxID=1737490 RepID=UPI000B347009|nr:hypothetical protein [Agarilytica rhodophyticola]
MNLYTIVFDRRHYVSMIWDSAQIIKLSNNELDHRIDMNGAPIRHASIFKEPLRVTFTSNSKEDKGLLRPEITVQQGRFYFSQRAYNVLKPLIENDGEFLPLIDEHGDMAYVFTPLRVAEDVAGLNTKLSRKNQWGDLESLAFHENKVKGWTVFRADFNAHMTPQCNQAVKDAIEEADLKGVFFTTDLGNGYSNQFDEGVQIKN